MALIIAPILFAASTFFLINGEYSFAAATNEIGSLFFWIPALGFILLKINRHKTELKDAQWY